MYAPLDELPELLQWHIRNILAEEKVTEGKTTLALHVAPDYEHLWNVHTYGTDKNGKPFHKRREVSKRDNRSKVCPPMLAEA